MAYRLIDHTADFGLLVTAGDPRDLFAEAAAAMCGQITDTQRLSGTVSLILEVDGADWPDLMVNWLREVLYCWTGKGLLIAKVDVRAISEAHLSARLWADRFDPARHRIKKEIKAVTYHQIQVFPRPEGWQASIIFDV